MRKTVIFILILFITMSPMFSQERTENKSDFPILTGPYLGQKPPGKIPEIFAPGIISTEANEHCFPSFSPDGDEVFWSRYNKAGDLQSIYYMQQVNGIWTKPDVAWFSGEISEGNVVFNHDGNKIYFCNDGHWESEGVLAGTGADIWVMEKGPDGWSEKKKIGSPLNTDMMEFFPYLSKNNTMYLQGFSEGTQNSFAIFKSEFINGEFTNKKPLSSVINSEYLDRTPCVDPEETFLIFSSTRPESMGSGDLFISFKTSIGSWDTPINMGPDINTEEFEQFPGLSPDGKYLFFTRGYGDIYWVDAKIIEDLKPKEQSH